MKKQLQHPKAYCSLYSEKSLTDLSHITLPFNVKFQVQTYIISRLGFGSISGFIKPIM